MIFKPDCRICLRLLYSGKRKQHTLKTQVVVDPGSEQIICLAQGLGRRHDFHLYKHTQVHLHPEIQLLADSGYQGICKLHPNSLHPYKRKRGHSLIPSERDWNRELAKERILCERVIGRLKVFRILSERYRNRRRRFHLRFNLIAALYNFEQDLFF